MTAQHTARRVAWAIAMVAAGASTSFASTKPQPLKVGQTAQVTLANRQARDFSIPLGKGELRRSGKEVAVLAFGTMVAPALKAGEELNATVANMRFVKPLDAALVLELAASHDLLVTVEEGCIMGGAGAAVMEALAAEGIAKPVLNLGLPDKFIDQGDPAALLASVGLDAKGIAASIRARFAAGEPRLVVINS